MKYSLMIRKISAAVLSLLLVFCLFGCETHKLDQNPGVQTEPAAIETTEAAETTLPAVPETLGADDFFDIDDAASSKIDSEKYAEKQITVQSVSGTSGGGQSGQPGNQGVIESPEDVLISDGSQQGQDQFLTDPVPEGQQMPVEPGSIDIDTSVMKTCYLSIDCSTILYNMENLTEGKDILVPSDGILFPSTAVSFYPGESVFDVLQRVTMDYRIHMSSRFTPIYNSAYIEAIGNLYEFDCGSGSGWMYNVNGWYPNYGVSRYVIQDGDVIEFNYTCDLGRDLGAEMVG